MSTYDWKLTSHGGARKQYSVYSCALVPTGLSSEEGAIWTPVMDFIPPGTDFTVIANATSTNMSASAHVELFVGYSQASPQPISGTTTRYRLNVTPFISVTSDIDQSSKVLFYDVSKLGQFPYYWLKIGLGASTTGSTGGADVIMKVIVGGAEKGLDGAAPVRII